MTIELKVPSLPESISDATVSTWHKKIGDKVSRDENLVDLETDKVMLEVPSPADGFIKEIIQKTGSTVQAQTVLAIIETAQPNLEKASSIPDKKVPDALPASSRDKQDAISPSARRAAAELEVDISQVAGTGKKGRITKENVIAAVEEPKLAALSTKSSVSQASITSLDHFASSMSNRPEKRVPMTRIRARIAERLLQVAQNTAMLTTFNEINMAPVMDLRSRYRDQFEKKYKVRLGFMSFFVKACIEALRRSPIVNASIDGADVVYHGYYDIGVAVSTDRGLIVPVLRNADQMSMAEIEIKIGELADKARTGKLSLEEMQGGTFTITNGGVFGSLISTPLLNSPQCAILGMHKIQERVVVESGQMVIRPMMYVALSYDHCLIDGRESVSFLVSVKELLEDPTRLILEV